MHAVITPAHHACNMDRLQAIAGEDLSSSDSDSGSEEELDQPADAAVPADQAAALHDAHAAQEGRSSSNAAGARGAEASGAQGCSGGGSGSGRKARASRAAGAGADIAGADLDNTDDSLRTYLEIVQSSQFDSEKTSTISALLRTERDPRVLSCFQEKGGWVGTGEAAHFQGVPVCSDVQKALLALVPQPGTCISISRDDMCRTYLEIVQSSQLDSVWSDVQKALLALVPHPGSARTRSRSQGS